MGAGLVRISVQVKLACDVEKLARFARESILPELNSECSVFIELIAQGFFLASYLRIILQSYPHVDCKFFV